MFVLFLFSGSKIDELVASIEKTFNLANGKLGAILEKQRASLNAGASSDPEKGALSIVWDVVLTLMIGYFVVSLINSSVNEYRVRFLR